MSKVFTLIVFCFFGSLVSNAQTWNWAKSFENNSTSSKTFNLLTELNNSNDIIASGFYYGTFYSDFDTLTSKNGSSSFISRVNQNGKILWLRDLISDQFFTINCQKIDLNDNIYLAGVYSGLNLKGDDTTIYNLGNDDGFLVKLDSSGNVIWLQNIGTELNEIITDIDVDKSGNIYLLGSSINYENNEVSLFIIKYNSNGTILKTKIGKYIIETSYPISINVTQNDEVFISGSVSGEIKFGNKVVVKNEDRFAAFLIEFDSDLNLIEGFVTNSSERISNIIFDVNKVYVYSNHNYIFDSIEGVAFQYSKLSCYDYKFLPIWTKNINDKAIFYSNPLEENFLDYPVNSTIDSKGNLITMFSSRSSKFIFGTDTAYLSTNYTHFFNIDIENYIVVHDSLGNEIEFFNYNSDLSSSGYAITSLSNGNIITSGTYQDSVFNIGQFQLLNPEELKRVFIFHGLYYDYRLPYTYLGWFSLSPTTGLISNQTPSLPSNLYPNPSNNFIKIKFEQPLKANSELIVFSIDGKLMTKQNFPSGTSEIQLDVSSFPKGMYLAGVQSGDERVVHKFLKE
jgi:hypothetical protein